MGFIYTAVLREFVFVFQILKVQVDSFNPGRRIPSCDLVINRHLGSKVEYFRVELEGAKEPFNYFSLECLPGNSHKLCGMHLQFTIIDFEISVRFVLFAVSKAVPQTHTPRSAVQPVSSKIMTLAETEHSCFLYLFSENLHELDINNAIATVNEWFELGQQLGLDFDVLEIIQIDNDKYGLKRQRGKMVNTWLRSDPEASWSKLCVALDTIGERAVAQNIRESFRDPGE